MPASQRGEPTPAFEVDDASLTPLPACPAQNVNMAATFNALADGLRSAGDHFKANAFGVWRWRWWWCCCSACTPRARAERRPFPRTPLSALAAKVAGIIDGWPTPIQAGKELAKIGGVGKSSVAKIDEVREAGQPCVAGCVARSARCAHLARACPPPPHPPPPPPLQFLNTGKLSALDDLGITPPTSAAAQAAMRFV